MNEINIINTGTREEAQKELTQHLEDVESNNRICNIVLTADIILCLLAVALMEHYMAPGILRNATQCIAFLIGGFIAYTILFEFYQSTCSMLHPAISQYHNIIEKYKILDIKVHQRSLWDVEFVVENDKHEVEHEYIYNFNHITKTDVDTMTVDIKNHTIYVPYNK